MTAIEIFFAVLANAASIAAIHEHQRYQRLDAAIRNLTAGHDRSDA